jgi:hypothetical protein
MRKPFLNIARTVSAHVVAVFAASAMVGCGEHVSREQLHAEATIEPTSQVYFGAEYAPIQAALKSESAQQPQPQAF